MTTASIKPGEMPILVKVLIALGFTEVGVVPLRTYPESYGHHAAMMLDRGNLSSYESANRTDTDVAGFIAEAVRFKLAEDKQKKVKLNNEYEAVITDKEVKVGCQSFSHEKILKVAKIVEEMKK